MYVVIDHENGPLTYPGIPDYKDLRYLIGGHLEAVTIPGGMTMYLNEEGKLMGLPLNVLATRLLQYPGDYIVGIAVVVGGPTEDGEDTGLTPEQMDALNVAMDVPLARLA